MDKKSLQAGVNLGGWISQYPVYDYRHFDTFITASDIRRIADWGCDHVRLPVDYHLLEAEENPGTLNTRGLEYIQRGLEWCRENGLRVIFDLHNAPGYSFDNYQAATFFDDQFLQERFLILWEMIAKQLQGTSDFVAFELLNEIVLPDSAPWNRLIRKAVDRIRLIDTERLIVIGGNYYSAVDQLARLDILADLNILYTFHFYEPMVVTHQNAYWVKALVDYGQKTDYPGIVSNLAEFLELHPEHRDYLERYIGKHLDKSTLLLDAQPAFDFIRDTGQVAYCGEYGVIESAPMQTRINWTRDFVSIFRKNKIGRAVWSYKAMDFGLLDLAGKVVNAELIKIISAH
jgi:endoglucanase